MTGTAPDRRPATASGTTFLPPRLPATVQPRARLDRRLGPDTGASWTLVVGPPGSGKTTLVRSWLERCDGAWTWIGLTAAPYGRPDLADLLVRGVQRARPDRPLDTLDSLDMNVADGSTLLGSLVDELVADDEATPMIVVLDDTDLLTTEEWTLLRWLVGNVPPTLHLVLIGRGEPPFPLGRERASGRMNEVRARDLAMELDETTKLVASTLGEPSPELAVRIHARTEGWAAGVRLAALAIRDGADPSALFDRFASSTSSVAEFLLEEVLERQPADRREFLRASASLSLLDPGLCDAVTGRSDSRDILRELATDGLFVTPAGDGSGRYRFHPLLAELLEYEQLLLDPDRAREHHRRAARWLVDHDRSIEAIEHLLAAGENEQAHRLVVDFFRPLYVGAHRRDLDRWLVAVPDRVIEESLDRAVDHCCALALIANPDGLRWWQWCDERIGHDDAWRRSRLDCVRALYWAVTAHLDEMRALWTDARARRPDGRIDPFDEVLTTWEIRLEAHLGDPAYAVERARGLQTSPRELIPDATTLSVLAGALDAAGETDNALAVAERAVERWRSDGEPELPGMVDAFTLAAAAARRRGDFDAADELVATALDMPPPRPVPHFLIAIPLIEAARIDHARGGEAWRRDLLGLAEELRTGAAPPEVAAWVDDARRRMERPPATPPVAAVPATRSSPPGLVEDLTEREVTILHYLASHLSFPEIGAELHISRHTVKSHVTHIYRKLGTTSRSEAIREARRLGLLD